MVHIHGIRSKLPIKAQKKELIALARLLSKEPITEVHKDLFRYIADRIQYRDGFAELGSLALTSQKGLASCAISALGSRGYAIVGGEAHRNNSIKIIPILAKIARVGSKQARLDSVSQLDGIASYPERLSKVPTPTASLRVLRKLTKSHFAEVRMAAKEAVKWAVNPPEIKLTPKEFNDVLGLIESFSFFGRDHTTEYLIRRVPKEHSWEFEDKLKKLNVDSSEAIREVLARLYFFFESPNLGVNLEN